jgi:hypothetical protein
MSNNRYIMSFTTGSIFHQESVHLARLYLELGDWNAVREKVIEENLFQSRTQNTLKRFCREVMSRLKTLSSSELSLLTETNHQEQGYLLWIAICRRYLFIAEFAIEILREYFIALKKDVCLQDFDLFYNRKSEWYSELEQIQPSTRKKLRQVLFKILREAGLLTADNKIIPTMLSPRFVNVIPHDRRKDILFFPALESDLQEKLQ